MYRRGGIRTRIAEEDPYGLALIRVERILLRDGVYRAIEKIVLGVLLREVLGAELLQASLALGCRCVDLALHDVVLVIDVRQPPSRLH